MHRTRRCIREMRRTTVIVVVAALSAAMVAAVQAPAGVAAGYPEADFSARCFTNGSSPWFAALPTRLDTQARPTSVAWWADQYVYYRAWAWSQATARWYPGQWERADNGVLLNGVEEYDSSSRVWKGSHGLVNDNLNLGGWETGLLLPYYGKYWTGVEVYWEPWVVYPNINLYDPAPWGYAQGTGLDEFEWGPVYMATPDRCSTVT
jgi:hypothetical protein